VGAVEHSLRCSVVIVTRNRHEFLRDAVRSILAGNRVPDEIVIVDQGDGAGDALASERGSYDLRLVQSSGGGSGRARNEGVLASRHPLVLLTDDDVLVDPAWIEQMLLALGRPGDRIVVTGRVLPVASSAPGRPVSIKTDEEPQQYEGRLGADVLFGNSVALYRSAFDEVGGFDERLGSGSRYSSADDNDLGYRLLEAGYRIHYVPEAVVHHRAWRQGRELRHRNWTYGRGQGAFYAKHLSLSDRHMAGRLAGLLLERTLAMIRRPPRKRSPFGHGELIYIVGVLSGFTEWLVRERRVR
jgi:GT2 family glycosyltransferase